MQQSEITVAGGGIIGLSIALELRRQGASVTVIDDARAGFASVAAAGMLAAFDPENPAELRSLAKRSLALYPDFLHRAGALADDEIPFETSFTLQLSKHPVETAKALSGVEAGHLLPSLAEREGFHLLTEHSLDPRRLHALLRLAADAAGVATIADTVFQSEELTAGVAITLSGGKALAAKTFIDCRGAWMPTARPRKGQLVRIQLHGELTNPSMGNVVIRTPQMYIVPRLDGSAVIGATVEDAGYDTTTSPDSAQRLISEAAALVPPIRFAPVTETWSGLRPSTGTGLPVIGRISDRVLVAGGHFRNGILLAPATAEAIADLVRGRQPRFLTPAFLPDAEAFRAAAITAQAS